jgi:molecular chaperone GrpE
MMAPTIALDGKERERLVDEFRACLERVNRPPAPADETCEGESPAVDLATLLGEMAVLKNELRLQSRQFKNTLDELRRFGNDLREHGERLQRDLDRAREQAAASRRQTERQFLLALVDLRDRLQTALTPPSTRRRRFSRACSRADSDLPPAWRRGSGSPCNASTICSPVIACGRCRCSARSSIPSECASSALKPQPSGSASLQEGTVLREVQRGFFHDGELLRVAKSLSARK